MSSLYNKQAKFGETEEDFNATYRTCHKDSSVARQVMDQSIKSEKYQNVMAVRFTLGKAGVILYTNNIVFYLYTLIPQIDSSTIETSASIRDPRIDREKARLYSTFKGPNFQYNKIYQEFLQIKKDHKDLCDINEYHKDKGQYAKFKKEFLPSVSFDRL